MNVRGSVIIPKLIVSIICFLCFQILFSQQFFITGYNEALAFTIIEESNNRLLLNCSVKEIDFYRNAGSAFPSSDKHLGLPTVNSMIAIPNGSKVLVNTTTTNQNSKIALVSISDPIKIRGIEIVKLEINPNHLDQIINELNGCQDFDIEIKFQRGSGHFGENRLRNKWWDSIFKNMLLNFESLPKTENNLLSKEDGAEYLIISPNLPVFQQWADSIKNFRTTQGILTTVVTME